ncbi:MAG: hypothetical protein HND52_09115 [Ignavibacteriae bacterium]|nr:hypothetical protein [Ignavibacteriota bacterium]
MAVCIETTVLVAGFWMLASRQQHRRAGWMLGYSVTGLILMNRKRKMRLKNLRGFRNLEGLSRTKFGGQFKLRLDYLSKESK